MRRALRNISQYTLTTFLKYVKMHIADLYTKLE